MSPAVLDESLTRVVGTRTANALEKLGLTTSGDLVRHYPRRYGRPGELSEIGQLRVGDHVTVVADVEQATVRPMRNRGGALLEAVVTDGRDRLRLTFFAKRAGALRPHEDRLRAGRRGLFTGTVGEYRGARQLTHPEYALIGADADEDEMLADAAKPIPIYPAGQGVPTWRIARAVRTVLDPLTAADAPDPIPDDVIAEHSLPSLLEALRLVHAPETDEDWQRGRERLRFEEAFVLQSALARRRAARAAMTSVARLGAVGASGADGGLVSALDARLPFALTDGQRAVGEAIASDLARPTPMMRLLQGDVGAGKTVVALRAMLQVVDSGGQAALLAPTEVLAAQHERTILSLLGPLAEAGMLGGSDVGTRVALLTGSLGAAARKKALLQAASGEAGIVVGTHALLTETVQFADLGLVVVDEQHRFGVEQRDALRVRGESPPHMLVMTATPIPRTVAMTVFGDLETSVLSERPAHRAETVTHVVPADNEAWMRRVWSRVREEVDAGRRVYVVCPRIDGDAGSTPSDAEAAGIDPLADAKPDVPLASVMETAEALRAEPSLAGVRVGVMHGRMTPDAKDAAMAAFASGETPVLVSTTVIEVGVDVREASTMVVLDAERFGISQLHQLRGRVGRGGMPGLCLLVTHAEAESVAQERLEALAETEDGFALAEKDVELRREGDVLGAAQSGGRNSLRLLRVVRDADVIAQARADAERVVAEDPELSGHPALAAAIDAWLGEEREEFLERG